MKDEENPKTELLPTHLDLLTNDESIIELKQTLDNKIAQFIDLTEKLLKSSIIISKDTARKWREIANPYYDIVNLDYVIIQKNYKTFIDEITFRHLKLLLSDENRIKYIHTEVENRDLISAVNDVLSKMIKSQNNLFLAMRLIQKEVEIEDRFSHIYCPYVPLTTFGVTVNPNTMQSTTEIMTRYGYLELGNKPNELKENQTPLIEIEKDILDE